MALHWLQASDAIYANFPSGLHAASIIIVMSEIYRTELSWTATTVGALYLPDRLLLPSLRAVESQFVLPLYVTMIISLPF